MTTGTGPRTSTSRTSTTPVSGTRLGEEETEDLKRAVRNKTMDDHRLDINDPWVLGTRLGGTKAEKKTEDEMTTLTDTKVKETNGRVQEGDGTMMSDQQSGRRSPGRSRVVQYNHSIKAAECLLNAT